MLRVRELSTASVVLNPVAGIYLRKTASPLHILAVWCETGKRLRRSPWLHGVGGIVRASAALSDLSSYLIVVKPMLLQVWLEGPFPHLPFPPDRAQKPPWMLRA